MNLKIPGTFTIADTPFTSVVEVAYDHDNAKVQIVGLELFDGDELLEIPPWLYAVFTDHIDTADLLEGARESWENDNFGVRK